MQKAEAKRLSLEVWRYLRDHPGIKFKSEIPEKLLDQIRKMPSQCPLCKYDKEEGNDDCSYCPLYSKTFGCASGHYVRWKYSNRSEDRHKAAAKIVEMIEAWDIGDR
jgi:hypothetical protein